MAIQEITVSKIYILATEPTKKVKDRFWFDTTNNILKRYDGTTWKPISVSSDDVAVLSDGSKISLTSYLNTQIAALAEGIDSKQDKLTTYKETLKTISTDNDSVQIVARGSDLTGNGGIISLIANSAETGARGGTIILNSTTIEDSEGNIVLNGKVSGTAISTSIPASESAVDTKVVSEKAVKTELDKKQDKLAFYSEVSGSTPSATISVADINLIGKVAEGSETTASGKSSHAEGHGTIASAFGSHAEGRYTTASSDFQHVQGRYNIDDANGKYADIIGNGSEDHGGSNAQTVSWEGISWSQTDVRAGGTDQDNATYSLAALAEGIDSKQDKLTTYKETLKTIPTDNDSVQIVARGTDSSGNGGKIELIANSAEVGSQGGTIILNTSTLENSEGTIILNGKVSGTAISTSIPASESAVDIKLPTEKAVATAINSKADKATTLAGYNIGDAYTKTEVNTELGKKQDKLTYYEETIKNDVSTSTIANTAVVVSAVDWVKIYSDSGVNLEDGSGNSIKLAGINIQINGSVSGTAISTSIPASESAVDTKLPSEKAVADAIKSVKATVSTAYKYKGSDTYANIVAKENPAVGDVWNSTTANGVYPKGTNYAWNGTEWDALGGEVDLSAYQTKAISIYGDEYTVEEAIAASFGSFDVIDAHRNTFNNPHKVTAAQVGLGNVNNTADADKPVSTAQQAALDLKQDKTDNTLATTSKTVVGAINEVKGVADSAAKADASNITVSTWKNKLGFITASEVPAQVQPDWNARNGTAQILNKPPISNYVEDPSSFESVIVTVGGGSITSKFKLGNKIIYDLDTGYYISSDNPLELKLNQACMWHVKISLCCRNLSFNFNSMYEFDISNPQEDIYYITKNDIASNWTCSLDNGVLGIHPSREDGDNYIGTIEISLTGVV